MHRYPGFARRCFAPAFFVLLSAPRFASAQSVAWIRQIQRSGIDEGVGASEDGLGNVYISGSRFDIPGRYVDTYDAFLSKYDAFGNQLWTRQLGTSGMDQGGGVSADRVGNVYITGGTDGDLGGPNAGSWDAFVTKYDVSGNLLWTRQLGSSDHDAGSGVSADGLGNVYISGTTFGDLSGPNAGSTDAFVSKYDDNGNHLWTRQFGTTNADQSIAVSADRLGNVFISGYSVGNLGDSNTGMNANTYDAFVSKYDTNGNLKWIRQFGNNSDDASYGVAADGLGNVYISGETNGSFYRLNPDFSLIPDAGDAFVNKYDTAGNLLWTRKLATAGQDVARSIWANGLGSVYITGYTSGSLGGASAGFYDTFVGKYDADGNLLWTRQFGSSTSDQGFGLSADGLGSVFISGTTYGGLAGPNGDDGIYFTGDAFVAKISDVPEPDSLALDAIGASMLWMTRRRLNRKPRSGDVT